MKKLAIVFVLVLAAGLVSAAAKDALSAGHRAWLDTVDPIMTATEREIFLSLKTDKDRDRFILFFWKQRDPFPDTPENEFRKEFQDRVDFADRYFGVGSHKRGHQTERGQAYLILGPPLERERFATQSEIWPMELWFYKGEEKYGLPPYFYLIFYQPDGLGEYRLYYPGIEGPEKLCIPSLYTDSQTRAKAVEILKKVSGELSRAALSYVPGEMDSGMTALSSESVIAAVRNLKQKKFADGYARSFLRFKDYVETEYTDQFLASDFKARLFRTNGQTFLHWTLEPERISFELRGGVYVAQFELLLRLEDPAGSLIYQAQDEIPLRLNEEQYRRYERRRFAFQDVFPVVEGEFKILLLLKNKTGRDFSSVEARVSIPAGGGPRLSDLVLSHGEGTVAEAERGRLKPFAFQGRQFNVSARDDFIPGETLVCALQGFGLDGLTGGVFSFGIFSLDGQLLAEADRRALAGAAGPEGALETARFDLAGLKPGYYEVRAAVEDAGGRAVLGAKAPFVLLSQKVPVAPWTFARVRDAFPSAEGLTVVATQYFMTGRYDRAAPLLERAIALKDHPAARLLLAKTLYAQARYADSLATARPVFEASGDREAAKVMALGLAGLKDWGGALELLEGLLEGATEVGVLNLAAECHLELGRPERAVPLLETSLSLVPGQPGAR
ncbi:MAG: GWxTD domain-containing protein, partial [Candidatus Aminicenantes bacterium]|nr:GWxTD domain-containing protein [Candidatus Aminicenantes bacterium]